MALTQQPPLRYAKPDPASAWLDAAPRPKKRGGKWRYRRGPSAKRNATEWAVILIGAVVAALLIRGFLFQAFFIPSESMKNTLNVGDRVLVNKFSYRLHDIHRGDIIVFRKPSTPQAQQCYADNEVHDLIKRVIALPGETVESRSGTIYVDGNALKETYIKPGTTGVRPVVKQTVPGGSVWVMGDNRDVSLDSRCAGPIPESDIVGRAFFVMWPLDSFRFL